MGNDFSSGREYPTLERSQSDSCNKKRIKTSKLRKVDDHSLLLAKGSGAQIRIPRKK